MKLTFQAVDVNAAVLGTLLATMALDGEARGSNERKSTTNPSTSNVASTVDFKRMFIAAQISLYGNGANVYRSEQMMAHNCAHSPRWPSHNSGADTTFGNATPKTRWVTDGARQSL